MTAIAFIGLELRAAAILSVACAIVFGGTHFLLLWSLETARGGERERFAPSLLAPEAAQPGREEATPRTGLTERRLSHLAELADVGLVQASRAGEIEFASSRARELLEIGSDLVPSTAWRQAFDAIQSRFSPDTTSTGAVQITTTSGTRLVSLKAHPVEDEDWSGFLVQVRDRRMLDALESDLRSASRLRVLNHVYLGVAHDLKGPLNAIMLTLEGLRADIDEGAGDKAHHIERLEIIRDELARHHRSLETLLAQTAPERLERQTFDLRTVVDHVARLIRPQLRHQKIELDLDALEPALVEAIPDRIREALLALVVNAMEAMPTGGTLGISTASRHGFATIDVRDSGDGIPDELRERIFDLRFTTKKTGTGIGLSTARSVVESEHGTLEVASTGEDGSTFRITLPSAGTE